MVGWLPRGLQAWASGPSPWSCLGTQACPHPALWLAQASAARGFRREGKVANHRSFIVPARRQPLKAGSHGNPPSSTLTPSPPPVALAAGLPQEPLRLFPEDLPAGDLNGQVAGVSVGERTLLPSLVSTSNRSWSPCKSNGSGLCLRKGSSDGQYLSATPFQQLKELMFLRAPLSYHLL